VKALFCLENQMVRLLIVITVAATLMACGRSLQTADLSSRAEFRPLVDEALVLLEGDQAWVLMNDPYDPLTNFSDGNVLMLIEGLRAESLVSGEIDPPNTPEGFFDVIGIVDGAQILIESVHEYGMETAAPVALGRIVLPDGRSFPFEDEWRSTYAAQVGPPN